LRQVRFYPCSPQGVIKQFATASRPKNALTRLAGY
jgi:hypothetical protein